MKIRIFITVVIIITCVIADKGIALQKEDIPLPGRLLHYDFGAHYPVSFVVARSGCFYLNNGYNVYKFDNEGKFLTKITVPLKQTNGIFWISDILVSDNEKILYINTGISIVSFDLETGKVLSNVLTRGDNLEIDGKGKFYTMYQAVINNNVVNKLRVISLKRSVADYPTSIDLAAANVAHIEEWLYFYLVDARELVLLPEIDLLTLHKPITKKMNGLPTGCNVIILGKMDGKFIFEYPDYKTHKDVIALFDADFKFVKKMELNLKYDEISDLFKTSDWMTDWPSGNIYSNDNKNGIYFMRNTKNGVYVCKLKEYIN